VESLIAADEVLEFGPLCMDVRRYEVTFGGESVELTRTEFSLLELLMRHPGCVLRRGEINERVWGCDLGSGSNALGIYVGYLRRKLEAGGRPRMIQTIRGVGYALRPPRS